MFDVQNGVTGAINGVPVQVESKSNEKEGAE